MKIGTAVFAATAIGAVPIAALRGVNTVVCIALFAVGTVLMGHALVLAAQRSREVAIGVMEMFFRVPKPLLVGLGLQTVIGLATAAARPYTSSALGVLVPVFGLGVCGQWGARHGEFPPRKT